MKFKGVLVAVGLFCLSSSMAIDFVPLDSPATLRAKAEQGNGDAQFYLGVMYVKGEGVPEDYKEAVKWFRLAAEQGDAAAQRNLGIIYTELAPEYSSYRDTNEITRDYVEGFARLSCAAIQGYELADERLSVCMEKMDAVAISKGKQLAETYATKHLQSELERTGSAQLPFGQTLVRDIKLKIYDEVDGAKKTSIPREMYGLYAPPKGTLTPLCNSFEECLQKAKAGDAPAMFELAGRYETGDGILKNADKSKQWLIASAERGYMPAIKKNGVLKYAFELYKQGNVEATFFLSKHPFHIESSSYLERAREEKNFFGEYVSPYRPPPEYANFREYESLTRVDYLKAAAKLGHSEAMYELAQYYFKNADYEGAYYWFGLNAAENPESALMAGFLRGMGWGCQKNHEVGFLYLLSAYGRITDNSSALTPEMMTLANGSLSKQPETVALLWQDVLFRCYLKQGFEPVDPLRIPDVEKSNKVFVLWDCLVGLKSGLSEKSVDRLKNLKAFGIDTSGTLALVQKALDEQKALKATIGKQITEIKAALESKYAALDKKKAEEAALDAAQRQRYEEEQRKERMIIWRILGAGIIAALVFIYGVYRAVRKFIRWRNSKPRIKKPLRIWQKILSGWIVWGVLVGLYTLFFEEEISEGVVFYPPIAATIAFIWWHWIKSKSQTTPPPEGTP